MSLKLKSTTHIGDPKLLAKAMRSYPWATYLNTRNYASEESKLFGLTKRTKLNLPPRFKYDSHRLHKVNYSILHPNTRCTRAPIEESLTHDENVVSCTTNMCPEYQWHILNCLTCQRMSAKHCKPTHGIQARPKWGRVDMAHLHQYK